jgi:hypothetical protein
MCKCLYSRGCLIVFVLLFSSQSSITDTQCSDGYVDIVAASFYDLDTLQAAISSTLVGRVEVYWGGASKTFIRQILTSSAAGARCLDLADVNRDGKSDFYVVYELMNTVTVWYAQPNRTFIERVISRNFVSPSWVRAYDVDGNGCPDAIVSSMDSSQLIIFSCVGQPVR